MRKSERDKRTYLMIGLCAVLVVMVVGFAAFSSQLQINGTSGITSNWNVRITKIEKIIPSGSSATDVSSECSESGTPKQCNDGLTATVSANLVSPGDSITYRIEVTNKGSLNAVLNRINLNDPSNNNVGFYINKDKSNQTIEDTGYRLLETNGVLNASGDSLDKGYVYLTIYYKDYEGQTSPTGGNKTVTATATFDFVQTNNEATPPTPAQKTAADVVEMMGVTPVTTGDGLYNNGDGTYTYKGSNPANYLSFAGSIWRILGIDSTGIKIIRDEKLDITMAFDSKGLRDSSSNGAGGTYCAQGSNGCNIWSKDYLPAGDYTNGSKTGTVLLDSELKTYLNVTYYTSTLSSNSNIIDGTYNVGPYNNESAYTWTGKVALLTAPEYNAAGGKTSYLKKSYLWWLLSPGASSTTCVSDVSSSGSISDYHGAGGTNGVRPVLYLSSNITLTGTGTDSSNAFTIS